MSGQIYINSEQISKAILHKMEIGPESAFITHHDVREAAIRAAELVLMCAGYSHTGNVWAMSTAEAAALLDNDESGQDATGRESEVVQ